MDTFDSTSVFVSECVTCHGLSQSHQSVCAVCRGIRFKKPAPTRVLEAMRAHFDPSWELLVDITGPYLMRTVVTDPQAANQEAAMSEERVYL